VFGGTHRTAEKRGLSRDDPLPIQPFSAKAGGGVFGTSMAHLRVLGLRPFKLCNTLEVPRYLRKECGKAESFRKKQKQKQNKTNHEHDT
jgi:hypothetical protein